VRIVSGARTARPRGAERECRKAEASELLTAARKAAGLTIADLAAEIGVSPTKVRAYEDPDAGASPVPLDAVLVAPVEQEAVRLLAQRAGMVAVELPTLTGPHDDLRLLAEVQRETSDVVREHLAAIADGVITRSENRACRVEIREAIAALVRMDLALEAVESEPCVGVRREVH
jgi:transcriptional regulator with XRE-family HTH domain